MGDLAHALVNQGKTADALKAVDSLKAMAKAAENPWVRSTFLIEAGRAYAYAGKVAEGRAMVDDALQQAKAHNFVLVQLRARITAAEIERKKGDAAKADAALAAVRAEALTKGLPLIVREAEAVRGK